MPRAASLVRSDRHRRRDLTATATTVRKTGRASSQGGSRAQGAIRPGTVIIRGASTPVGDVYPERQASPPGNPGLGNVDH